MTAEWSDFQEHIYKTIRKNYPAWQGWKIERQKELATGRKPDFVIYKSHKRVVIDAKDKAKLTSTDIDQVWEYKATYKASRAIISIAHDTEVPQSVREYANEAGIEIHRTFWRWREQ